jgi:hypothetical protein
MKIEEMNKEVKIKKLRNLKQNKKSNFISF